MAADDRSRQTSPPDRMNDTILDYGRVAKAKQMPDGSIRFYGRIACAERDYKYINTDGSTRIERISRDELFKKSSIDSLKLAVLTHPHAPVPVTPDNYDKYSVGGTGELIINGADGDFLGILGCLRRRDAIEAFNSGIRELSPGYYRKLSPAQADGKHYQLDRNYYEISLVERARGGADVRIKDGDWYFDPDNEIRDWDEREVDSAAIDRLLIHGRLDPPPVILTPKHMKLTFGDRTIEVATDSVDDAIAIKTKYDSLATAQQDAIALRAKLDAAERANTELAQRIKDGGESLQDRIADTVRAISKERERLPLLERAGLLTDTAKQKLDSCDLVGFKAEIVSKLAPDLAADSADVYYEAYLSGIAKDMTNLTVTPNGGGTGMGNRPSIGNFQLPAGIGTAAPNMMGALAHYLGANSGEAAIANGSAGANGAYLPPDDNSRGWV